MHRSVLLAVVASLALVSACVQASHPRLLLTKQSAEEIRESLEESPRFVAALDAAEKRVVDWFADAPDVPMPRDAGGGYTHEQHKKNGIAIYEAGLVFQMTGKEAYADAAGALLLEYAALYPSLGAHPKKKEQSPGRLFWQSLNEAVWLVYAIQGYDAVYEYLPASDREVIESQLLIPMADFMSAQSPETFDKIHNHGTWAVAAVGMTGFVIDKPKYVQQALYGLSEDGSAGFMRQLDELFSPDGYYSEGPYYQRYALMPFVLFARSVETNMPENKIFEHRDGILLKAIRATVDLSYARLFFPINDAIKDKGLDTVELRYGIATAYALTGDTQLLSILADQPAPMLTADGFAASMAIDAGRAELYNFSTTIFHDGAAGDQGALAILRAGEGEQHTALVFKATAQGMGHGHFDKLHWMLYDNGHEIVSDYGAARFLNIEQKYGGHYLPENKSWAKQTVAHNTLVVDERSHFDAKLKVAETRHPEGVVSLQDGGAQLVAATMRDVYDGVDLQRTMLLLEGVAREPVVIDVLKVLRAPGTHQYDLPLHFDGQIINTSVPMQAEATRLSPLGEANGYQHLWLKAETAVGANQPVSLTWLTGNRFYTQTTLMPDAGSAIMAELGANDPNFNLRRQQALIIRSTSKDLPTFVSVMEPHGEYNGTDEYTVGNYAEVRMIERHARDGADLIRLTLQDARQVIVALSYDDNPERSHSANLDGVDYEWRGYFKVFDEQVTQ